VSCNGEALLEHGGVEIHQQVIHARNGDAEGGFIEDVAPSLCKGVTNRVTEVTKGKKVLDFFVESEGVAPKWRGMLNGRQQSTQREGISNPN